MRVLSSRGVISSTISMIQKHSTQLRASLSFSRLRAAPRALALSPPRTHFKTQGPPGTRRISHSKIVCRRRPGALLLMLAHSEQGSTTPRAERCRCRGVRRRTALTTGSETELHLASRAVMSSSKENWRSMRLSRQAAETLVAEPRPRARFLPTAIFRRLRRSRKKPRAPSILVAIAPRRAHSQDSTAQLLAGPSVLQANRGLSRKVRLQALNTGKTLNTGAGLALSFLLAGALVFVCCYLRELSLLRERFF